MHCCKKPKKEGQPALRVFASFVFSTVVWISLKKMSNRREIMLLHQRAAVLMHCGKDLYILLFILYGPIIISYFSEIGMLIWGFSLHRTGHGCTGVDGLSRSLWLLRYRLRKVPCK